MEAPDPIRCGLPHREPFVFVDKVLAVEAGRSAVCTKFFSASEPFFRGHFPVILTEAAAQTAGIAAGQPGRIYHLSAIRQMKFISAVPPDTSVEFSATKSGGMGGLLQFQVSARVGGELVAEGVIVLNEVA